MKVGFKEVYLSRTCFPDAIVATSPLLRHAGAVLTSVGVSDAS